MIDLLGQSQPRADSESRDHTDQVHSLVNLLKIQKRLLKNETFGLVDVQNDYSDG